MAASDPSNVSLGRRNGLTLAIAARKQKTVGEVIASPESAELIAGVKIEPLRYFPDDRGFFAELARLGSSGVAEGMTPSGEARIQVSATLSYAGTIKAFHYHFEQTDLWAPLLGMIQVSLCDLRRESKTFGRINTLYVGAMRPWAILIPPGVGHGYKVLGTQAALLVYVTNRFYNPDDEGRLAFDHPEIAYDWDTQHR